MEVIDKARARELLMNYIFANVESVVITKEVMAFLYEGLDKTLKRDL